MQAQTAAPIILDSHIEAALPRTAALPRLAAKAVQATSAARHQAPIEVLLQAAQAATTEAAAQAVLTEAAAQAV